MKKIASIFVCCCMALALTLTAFAEASEVSLEKNHIALSDTQTAFEAVIEIKPQNAYAGIEIGIACPKGVAVTASSGSSGSMSAPPVLANGLYWTSFFESGNKLSGTMKITLQLSCPQTFEAGDLLVQEVRVLTKDGASVVTETLKPSLKVYVTRTGADASAGQSSGAESTVSAASRPSAGDDSASDAGSSSGTDSAVKNNPNNGNQKIPATGERGGLHLGAVLLCIAGIGVMGTALVLKKKADRSL
ncbi:hypothetical protein [Candidatus Soleaferrea massiliensis]|uniref:hypothetical protein n=1 Tax=Candidatus Soleaferrea massiliensis TaxID=1470354 RepID=UPI00058B32F0|nr:hypothetical protein [Candidatus Soleaferrea massiliensis]